MKSGQPTKKVDALKDMAKFIKSQHPGELCVGRADFEDDESAHWNSGQMKNRFEAYCRKFKTAFKKVHADACVFTSR